MRTIIQSLEKQFHQLNNRSIGLIGAVDPAELFRKPLRFAGTMITFSSGEFILRSAGSSEQVFAGIMTRLWDDPFEWTLPEYMVTPDRILNYLNEVGETITRGFQFLTSDDDLSRSLPAPRELTPIVEILLSAYERSARFQGKAETVHRLLSHQHSADDIGPAQTGT